MAVRLSAGRVFRWHLASIVLLATLNLLVLAGDAAGYHGMLGFSPLFRLADEGNAPTIFSALAILAASLVAARIAQAGDGRDGERSGWRILAVVLAFMALDEAIQIHEAVTAIVRLDALQPWLLPAAYPYAIVALILGLLLFRFWLAQSRAVRLGIALGGTCYLVSAVGMEIVAERLFGAGVTVHDVRFTTAVALEEIGEMLAVALLLRAFLSRFTELGGGPLLALVGVRPMLAVRIEPDMSLAPSPQPTVVRADARRSGDQAAMS